MKKLIVEKGCNISPNKIKILSDFVLFCIEKLNIYEQARLLEGIPNRAAYFIENNTISFFLFKIFPFLFGFSSFLNS